MKREEMIKMMDEKGYELTKTHDGEIIIDVDTFNLSEEPMRFKSKKIFPIIFEDGLIKVEINANNGMTIENIFTGNKIYVNDSFKILYDAVIKLNELRGKDGL